MAEQAKPTLNCPICRRKVAFDDPEMPFCSDRCRQVDLGNWATEKYVIPSPSEPVQWEDESDGSE